MFSPFYRWEKEYITSQSLNANRGWVRNWTQAIGFQSLYYNLICSSYLQIYLIHPCIYSDLNSLFPGKCCCLRISVALVISKNQSKYLFNKFFPPNRVKNKEKITNSHFLFHSSSGCTMKGQHTLNSQKYSEIFHYKATRHWIINLGVENPPSHLWTLLCTCLIISYLLSASHTTEHQQY